jgi:carbon storage regulator
MFIITRRLNQGLVIGQDLKVGIVGIRGSQVRIGIEAPRDVTVHRAEIVERIRRESGNKGDAAATKGCAWPKS